MALDYHLENKVFLKPEPKFLGLYDWCLLETKVDGSENPEQIPWNWGLYFTAMDLRYSNTITISPNSGDR